MCACVCGGEAERQNDNNVKCSGNKDSPSLGDIHNVAEFDLIE